MKKEYRILEEKLDDINEKYIKSLGHCKHSKYKYILNNILNKEYYWFIRFVLLKSLNDSSDISSLCDQIVTSSIEYIVNGIEIPINDYECKNYKIIDFIKKYDDYMSHIESFNYSIRK